MGWSAVLHLGLPFLARDLLIGCKAVPVKKELDLLLFTLHTQGVKIVRLLSKRCEGILFSYQVLFVVEWCRGVRAF